MDGYDAQVRLVLLNGLLILALTAAITGVQVTDRTSAVVEATVRRYAEAVTQQDLNAALAEIAPENRERWRPWISGQLGNIYEVKSVAVRWPSLMNRGFFRAEDKPIAASVLMDVNRGYPADFYQPTTHIGVEYLNGQVYLSEPLLAPPELR